MCNNTNITFAGIRETAGRTIRLYIRKGMFTQWMGKGQQPQEYDFVQGSLTGISLRKKETHSGEITYLDLHFESGGTRFDVSMEASSSVAAELMSKLANIRDVRSVVRIDVWTKGQYTNCAVREDGERLPFCILPKIVKKQQGFSTSFDTSERDEAVMKIISELNTRIAQVARPSDTPK